MSQQFRLSPLVFAVALMIALIAWLYWPQAEVKKQRPGRETPVVVATVTQQPFTRVVEALGTASANEAVVITAQETDKVQQLYFEDGDFVAANQLLVILNSAEEEARVSELQVALAEAQRQLNRVTNLAKENAASEQLLDERQAAVDTLRAQILVAQAQLNDREIRAPFQGVLGVRNVSEGALVRPGDQITTLDDVMQLKVDFDIAEKHLPGIALKQTVQAKSIAYPGQIFEGQVTHIDSRVNPITRTVQVRAILDNPQVLLRPGMLLQVVVQKQVMQSLVISETALVPIDDEQFVYVIDGDSKAIKTKVVIGERKPGVVQVVSGVSAGDKVVTEGTLRLRDGATVNVVGESE